MFKASNIHPNRSSHFQFKQNQTLSHTAKHILGIIYSSVQFITYPIELGRNHSEFHSIQKPITYLYHKIYFISIYHIQNMSSTYCESHGIASNPILTASHYKGSYFTCRKFLFLLTPTFTQLDFWIPLYICMSISPYNYKNPIFKPDLTFFKKSQLFVQVEFCYSVNTYIQYSGSTTKAE